MRDDKRSTHSSAVLSGLCSEDHRITESEASAIYFMHLTVWMLGFGLILYQCCLLPLTTLNACIRFML